MMICVLRGCIAYLRTASGDWGQAIGEVVKPKSQLNGPLAGDRTPRRDHMVKGLIGWSDGAEGEPFLNMPGWIVIQKSAESS
jgi:hypothetical protein